MSCISNNFSPFFLNPNDPSEFTKYLSNGELKFSNIEDLPTSSQQQQQYPQTQQCNNSYSNNSASNNNNPHVNGDSSTTSSSSNCNNGTNSNSSIASCYNNGNGNGVFPAVAATSAGEVCVNGGGVPMEVNTYTHPSIAAFQQIQQQQQHQSQQQQHQHPHHHHHPQQHSNSQHMPQYICGASSPAHLAQPQTPSAGFTHNHHHAAVIHTNLSAVNTTTNPQHAFTPHRWTMTNALPCTPHDKPPDAVSAAQTNVQHFDGSFEFLKYLRHSNVDYSETAAAAADASNNTLPTNTNSTTSTNHAIVLPSNSHQTSSLIDLDSSTSHKSSRSSRKAAALLSSVSRASACHDSTALDVFDDHNAKHTIFDLHQTANNNSNSNESAAEISNLAFSSTTHLNASNSNTSSEGAAAGNTDFIMLNSSAPKPLANFIVKENFEVHAAHKIEEGIFQHMNKLPSKKKENLKQLGVRFTGQMTLTDKSIVVENFIKFCQEYDVRDHRPFLSLNQSGLNKPEQIKFARYLGQGLPTFTLFCIYSNFKNLFCTKRTETYTKDGYNLPYILDKTKRYLSNTTADLKNMMHQQSNDSIMDFSINNSNTSASNAEQTKCVVVPKVLENMVIYENFDVHETHRIEDGICTQITRLPPKKQEILKQFGIQNNQTVAYYEKYIIIENFTKFSNEYKISDHRPFLDFHESGLPKQEQIKFVRYLGQGLPNLTLNKIYLTFKDVLGLHRIEKLIIDGYNLDMILKKKRKNLYNRINVAVHKDTNASQTHHKQPSLRP